MLGPIPLHEPAAVFDVLATLRVGRYLPTAGLAVLHDVPAEHAPGYVVIPDVPDDPPQHHRVRALQALFRSLAAAKGATSTALVILRQGHAAPRGGDYAWYDTFHAAVTRTGLTPAGVYVFADGVLAPIRTGASVAV